MKNSELRNKKREEYLPKLKCISKKSEGLLKEAKDLENNLPLYLRNWDECGEDEE